MLSNHNFKKSIRKYENKYNNLLLSYNNLNTSISSNTDNINDRVLIGCKYFINSDNDGIYNTSIPSNEKEHILFQPNGFYTIKKNNSTLKITLNLNKYYISGSGHDRWRARLYYSVDNITYIHIANSQQFFEGSSGSQGTRSGTLSPVVGIVKNINTNNNIYLRCTIQSDPSDDTLSAANNLNSCIFEILEINET